MTYNVSSGTLSLYTTTTAWTFACVCFEGRHKTWLLTLTELVACLAGVLS